MLPFGLRISWFILSLSGKFSGTYRCSTSSESCAFERVAELLGYPLVIWSSGGVEMGFDSVLPWYDTCTGHFLCG